MRVGRVKLVLLLVNYLIGCIVGHVVYNNKSTLIGHIIGHIGVLGGWWSKIGRVVGA